MATAREVNAAVEHDPEWNRTVPRQVVSDRAIDPTIVSALIRASFMEDISRELVGSLNVRRTMTRLLRLATPKLGDWAMLAVFEGGAVHLQSKWDSGAATKPITLSLTELENSCLTALRSDQASDFELLTSNQEIIRSLSSLVLDKGLMSEIAEIQPENMLCASLVAEENTIGALFLVRGAGKHYDENTRHLAKEFSQRAANALNSAREYEDRAEIAAVVEASLRPPELPEIPGMSIAARYRTASEHNDIGGDFYDVHGADNDWLMVLGDVCGKGTAAAVLQGRARQTVRTAAHFDRSPSAILSALNEVLVEDENTDRFVTLACARLNIGSQGTAKIVLAIAGHPSPLVLRANGAIEQPDVSGTLSGVVPELSYQEITLELQSGDLFLLYTDGIYEAKGVDGLFGINRLRELLGAYAGADPEIVCSEIETSVLAHLDGKPHDDMALLALRCGN